MRKSLGFLPFFLRC